jgi:ELWxxDGT repeat protein
MVKTLFSANDGTDGTELWVTDGSVAGTSMLADIFAGASSSNPTGFTALGNGQIVFQATDATNGTELWVTDGTATHTSLLKNIAPGASAGVPLNSNPTNFFALGNGKALFQANDAVAGAELWVTDGTAAGTSLLKDIRSGGSGSFPQGFAALGNGLTLFQATDATHGAELWVTDGTTGNTSLLADINPGTTGSSPTLITALGNGTAVFEANDGTNGKELWVTDGTGAHTSLLMNINPGKADSSPTDITLLGNGVALFQAKDATHGQELWVTDGTATHTSLLKDIIAGVGVSLPNTITALGNGTAVFQAKDSTDGVELWVTDGIAAHTSLLKDINTAQSGSSTPTGITALGNGKAVFQADNGTGGTELWITDGTAAGTSLVKDINPGAAGSAPTGFTAIGNGSAVFQADNGTSGLEAWVTDGTLAGTFMLKDANPGNAPGAPTGFTVDTVCFTEGTGIATSRGVVAVEALRPGDIVLTHAGATRPIRWIGQRHLDLTRHPAPERVQPIRILAGAFADGVPCRDLRLSPDHAVLLDGLLIPVRMLVNGVNITRENDCRAVSYFHVELDAHDILLAEGLPSESYLDTGNRHFFGAGGALLLHPDLTGTDGQARREAESCAPFAADALRVEPIWQRLAIRSTMLGCTLSEAPQTTDDPELRVMIGERSVQAISSHNGHYVFALPSTEGAIRLTSRTAVPSEAQPWNDDRRRLGVMVSRLTVRTSDGSVEPIPLDHPALEEGWWDAEGQHSATALRRWTDGHALLPIGTAGPVLLEVELCGTLGYPMNAIAARAPMREAA